MSDLHTGGCRCGAVRFQVAAEPQHISYCHCADCRQATGAPVSAFVGFPADAASFGGDAPRTYINGPVTRSFCGTCGSPIAYVDSRIGDAVYFMLGAMDAPHDYKPTQHAYVREQLPFVHMPDGLLRHVRNSVTRHEDPDGTTS